MILYLVMRAIFREDREEELLAAFLPSRGFFVEVGAFDPIALSQTFHLEQRGWDGILVEPIPSHAQNLRAARRARVVEAACGSPSQHGQRLPIYVAAARSSLKYQHGEPILVPVVTLDSVLADAGACHVDFLSVDVEGAEIDVLTGLSFDRVRPTLVLIEDFADDFSRHRFMRKFGFRRVRRTGNNSWYVPEEAPFAVSVFGRWQLFRKYVLSLPVRRLKNMLRDQ